MVDGMNWRQLSALWQVTVISICLPILCQNDLSYCVQQQNELSKHVNDAGEALKYPPGEESYNKLKAFVEVEGKDKSPIWSSDPRNFVGIR